MVKITGRGIGSINTRGSNPDAPPLTKHMFKKLINLFRKEVWTKVKEESATVRVEHYGTPCHIVKATLVFEESNKGNKRHWMNEHSGVLRGKPYLFDFDKKRPVKDVEGQNP